MEVIRKFLCISSASQQHLGSLPMQHDSLRLSDERKRCSNSQRPYGLTFRPKNSIHVWHGMVSMLYLVRRKTQAIKNPWSTVLFKSPAQGDVDWQRQTKSGAGLGVAWQGDPNQSLSGCMLVQQLWPLQDEHLRHEKGVHVGVPQQGKGYTKVTSHQRTGFPCIFCMYCNEAVQISPFLLHIVTLFITVAHPC